MHACIQTGCVCNSITPASKSWRIFMVNICAWLFSFWSYPGAIKGLPGANLRFCARYSGLDYSWWKLLIRECILTGWAHDLDNDTSTRHIAVWSPIAPHPRRLCEFSVCGIDIHDNTPQTTGDMLSESPRCNDMVADLHFPRFFGTPIQCEIAQRFLRSVVKVGPNVQCKNISILSGVQPWTSTDLKLSYFNTGT